MNAQEKLVVYLVAESTERSLTVEEREIVFDGLENLSSLQDLDKVLRVAAKASLNPSTRGVFRKEAASQMNYKFHHARRGKRPSRKRGYTDKGSLAESTSTILRELQRGDFVPIVLLSKPSLQILSYFNEKYRLDAFVQKGEWIDLESFRRNSERIRRDQEFFRLRSLIVRLTEGLPEIRKEFMQRLRSEHVG